MASSQSCVHCGSTEIDIDRARGDAVCTKCGAVLEDTIIVSEVQFEENTGGASRAVGQMVTGTGAPRISGLRFNSSKESREITLSRVRQRMREVAGQLGLNDDAVETAMRFYEMALMRGFCRGRVRNHVVAACVYLTCRLKETPHLLLDLSDVVQVNVYQLGRAFTQLANELFITVPTLDPCIYISRYARRLDFDNKLHAVSMTAMRLVQRMKRDWMGIGRRPSSICGAALLVAARLHGFNRGVEDLVDIVHCSKSTIRKRLSEFAETPSSRLTLDEFGTIDLEEEQDPPCFKEAKRKQQDQKQHEQLLALLEDGEDPDGLMGDVSNEMDTLGRIIEAQLEERQANVHRRFSRVADGLETFEEAKLTTEEEELLSQQFIVDETMNVINKIVKDPCSSQPSSSGANASEEVFVEESLDSSIHEIGDCSSHVSNCPTSFTSGPGPTLSSLGLKDSLEECMKVKPVESVPEETGELDLTGIDDAELDGYILTKEESMLKRKLWINKHADFLREQREKEERRAKEALENPQKVPKKRRSRKKFESNTPTEAIQKIIQEKKISKKINYDVLKSLSDDFSISSATDLTNDSAKEVAAVDIDAPSTSEQSPSATPAPKRRRRQRKKKGTELDSDDVEAIGGVLSRIKEMAKNDREARRTNDDDGESDDDEGEESEDEKMKTTTTSDEAPPSSAPPPIIQTNDEDLDEDVEAYEEEDGGDHLSAAQLLSRHRGADDDYALNDDVDCDYY